MFYEIIAKYASWIGIIKFLIITLSCITFFSYISNKIMTKVLFSVVRTNNKSVKIPHMSEKIGNIERMIYILATITDAQQIILGWFALKAIQNPFKSDIKLISLNENNCSSDDNVKERVLTQFQYIIIGNGLSLILGILGGIITKLILKIYA